MLHLVKSSRAYDPETIAVMTAALDKVCQSLSAPMIRDEEVRRRLAEAILFSVDQGQRDPQAIAFAAMDELTGGRRSASR